MHFLPFFPIYFYYSFSQSFGSDVFSSNAFTSPLLVIFSVLFFPMSACLSILFCTKWSYLFWYNRNAFHVQEKKYKSTQYYSSQKLFFLFYNAFSHQLTLMNIFFSFDEWKNVIDIIFMQYRKCKIYSNSINAIHYLLNEN